jgi:hypothetical protein
VSLLRIGLLRLTMLPHQTVALFATVIVHFVLAEAIRALLVHYRSTGTRADVRSLFPLALCFVHSALPLSLLFLRSATISTSFRLLYLVIIREKLNKRKTEKTLVLDIVFSIKIFQKVWFTYSSSLLRIVSERLKPNDPLVDDNPPATALVELIAALVRATATSLIRFIRLSLLSQRVEEGLIQ